MDRLTLEDLEEIRAKVGEGSKVDLLRGIPVFVEPRLPQPLLDKDGNRALGMKLKHDDRESILVHPDDLDEFAAQFKDSKS